MTRLSLVFFVGAHAIAGCDHARKDRVAMITGGDPDRGRVAAREHGCGSCHTIPGVRGAHALVGPPLEKMADRAYIAGSLPNTPANLSEWIAHPQKVKPNNAMPEVPISDQDARDITAYLYTLR